MTGPVLELQDVHFAWPTAAGPVTAVKDASLTLHGGDYLGLIGANGSGKSTLLKLALGLLKPDQGTVQLLGDAPERTRHRVGFVPQATKLNTDLPGSVLDVVLCGRLARSFFGLRYNRADHLAATEALDRVGLADLARRPADALSGGQRQRVLLARALASAPDLLILDEPASGADPVNHQRLTHTLRELHQDGLPIIVVSHDTAFVSAEVTHIACMHHHLHIHKADEITDDILEQAGHAPLRHLHPHTHDCDEC